MADQLIWIVDDDDSMRWVLERALTSDQRTIQSFSSADQALEALKQTTPSLILTDLRMPGTDGLQLLNEVSAAHPDIPVIVMTAYSDLDTTVDAYHRGAHEYLPKPFDIDEAISLVEQALEAQPLPRPKSVTPNSRYQSMLGESAVMQQLFRHIGRLSRSSLNVLIIGETGVGKELVAQALHRHSPSSDGPFVALNTAAIPSELLEAELFGYEKGAFTGAHQQQIGRFEQADGGTLFLDEIGDMPAPLQTRLLRVLAEGEFYRIGGRRIKQVDVRIVAATHQDLQTKVNAGAFREDLYHRLNVVQISVPALRERGDDVLLLTEHFLKVAAAEINVEPKQLDTEAHQTLLDYPWPGNVRELENLCRRLTVMAAGSTIRTNDLNQFCGTSEAQQRLDWQTLLRQWAIREFEQGKANLLEQAQAEFQWALIQAALERTDGRRSAAAALLGCGRNTLTRWLKEMPEKGMDFITR